MTTPAGWHPDPDGSGGQRYFDGHSWTDHRAPAVEALPPDGAAPAVRRSSGPKGKVIAGVIAAAVAVIVGAAAVVMTLKTDVGEAPVTRKPSGAAGETSVVPSESGSVEAPLENRASSVGQRVRDGNFEFVVTGFDRAPAVTDPEFPTLQKAAAGEYVLVKMTVTNVSAEPQTFFASYNTLSDGNTEYKSDDEAWIYLGNTLADLNPGDSIDTAVVFDVPVGTDPQSIELHDGPLSKGVTVRL